ncbi:MAG TPA: hypothetical protein VFI29_12330, partial [Hanamia sp.]|nr:hypothetical protein [Hanamia sp.]
MKNKQTLQLTKDELQKQLKRKSASLERMKRKMKISEEVHSREAQIEAALEKVRSCSLAMHKSDELRDVVKVVFEKLQELDFAIDGAAFIGTLIENSQDINIWIGDKHAEYPSCFRTPVYDAPSVMDILKAKESGADFFSRTYSFEEKNKWFEYAFQHTDYKTLPDQLKNWVLEQPFLTQSFAWAENSGVGIHFHHKITLSENEIDILKRFSKVFEQGYVRFLDLQKAEAQAREAKIEAALEKIRSRSLAMQKSDELKDVIAVVFEKLKELGLVFDGAGIQLFRHGSRDSVLWVSSEISEPSLINLPYIEKANENSEFINTLWTARKTGNDIYNRTYSFDEKNKYFNYVISNNPQIPASIRELMFQSPSYTLTMIMKKNSALIADSFSGKALSLEEYNILGRVASVFEQVYVRFLDLQKAEAQAREAQIELALERVRAKTMAMQKSDELKEVIQLVYDQFVHLNIYIEHTGFLMDYKERDDLHIWLADRHLVPSEVTIPWFDSLPNNSIKEAKEKGQDFFKYLLDFEEKNKFYQDLFMFIPGVPEETLKYYLNCPGLAGSGVLLENIGLYIENFEGTPYTDEENDTLMRLGKVFQQTYTRFLDLEKAEAQARESQIQLVLERVRARTMAMQKSDELSETVYVLFQQFNELGEKPDQATIWVINEDEKLIEYWVTMYGKPINKVFKFSIDEPNVTNKIYKAWKENKKSLMIDLSGDALTEFMAYRAEKGGAAINRDEKRRVINVAFFSKGLLNVQSNEERSEESIKLLERFASVFEQTYTRFLDLQKAEAQAREAQIELGLERVRARAMAMQTSEELNALIGIVFTELTKLDLVLTRCVIIIYDAETKGAQWWMANSEAPSAPMNFFVKYANLPFFNMYLKGWEERDLKWQYILEGENKIITDNFLFNETELKTLPDFVIEGMKVPHKVYLNASFNNFGNLTLATLEPLSEKHFDILLRFAKVFDLTYTRFNDLQKAEAQAREAEIQLALERVRARTMAMQKQDDLLGVLDLLVEQLVKLGVNLQVANFSNGIPGGDWDLWIEVVADANNIFNNYVHFPRIDHPYFHHVEKNIESFRKDGTDLFKDVFSKEEKDSWQDYIDTQTIYKDLTSEEIRQSMYEKPGYTWSMIILKDTWVSICRYDTIPFSVEDDVLLRRFANAFGQTYTRFLDLQKAEAQAREAQIEAALERVRSRSMAMFKSEELSDVITVVADQLQQLDVRFEHVSFVINSDAEDYHFWTALYGKPHPYELKVPYLDNPIANRVKKARSQGIKFFQDTLTPEENRLWLEHAFSNNPVDFFTPEEKAYAISRGFSRSIALMPNIMLAVGNYASKPYSDDNNDIIKRFASVFEQSYTRFLDLKKSEAQAREAQIEAALERVRSCTLAMQKSDELANTSAVLFQQLIHLGIAPNRLYIGITNDKNTDIEFWITDEDGSKVSTMFSGDAAKNISIKKMYDGWKQEKKSIVIDMRDKELDDYFHYLG